MCNAKKTTMLESNGIKVGVIGIVEKEWLDTLNQLPPNLHFLPASDVVKEHGKALREQGAQMIIVLSHQREPNDIKLAQSVPAGTIDLMLGGHDHFYAHSIVNGCHLLRSGTDFKQLSYLEAWHSLDKNQGWDYRIIRRDITSEITQDPHTMTLVNDMTSSLRSKLDKPIGYTAAPLDARFTTVRLKESNLGNFVCDLMRVYYNTDCTIMAGGTIRGDQVYPPGVLKVADIMNCAYTKCPDSFSAPSQNSIVTDHQV
jgi:5'-nucleotidase